jgi:hypothetical protein
MVMLRTFVLRDLHHVTGLTSFIAQNWLAMAKEGKPLAVQVMPHKSKRSVEQNARLHAILQDIAENAWVDGKQFDMETWKEFFRRRFIGTQEIVMPDGEIVERGVSTTTLDVHAFGEFMVKIEEYAGSVLAVEFAR